MTDDLSPIVREFAVECSVEHAFDTWTRRIDLWWPLAQHSVSHDDAASVAIEPRQGGRLFETTRSGEEIPWGTVIAWDPPERFAYLWFIGEPDASQATDVTITFTALAPNQTRVRIEHKGWEKVGTKRGARRRGNERGWDGLENAFTLFTNAEAKT
jgi:hypothetical protein